MNYYIYSDNNKLNSLNTSNQICYIIINNFFKIYYLNLYSKLFNTLVDLVLEAVAFVLLLLDSN